jgi:amidophosphoribosyltransferase
MTNTPYLSHRLDNLGLSLTNQSDTQIILDSIAYQFDQQYHRDIKTDLAASSDRPLSYGNAAVDIVSSLKSAAKDWDGGYVFCGIVGSGDVFACRDPAGIRPGFVLITEEVVAVASERVSLAEAFGVDLDEIAPIQPGHVIVVKKSGEISDSLFTDPLPEKQCTFERIYFSKPSDPEIYKQRKALGRQLAPVVFDALGKDLKDAIFTYVPNSSISAFQGLVEEIAKISHKTLLQKYIGLGPQALDQFSYEPPRVEYIIAKNQKIRTFISSEQKRGTLVRELTQGIVGKEHTLVVVDDSIVRGTTLQESLLPKLIKLNPKKIIIVSSAPPVMYPDCYGIDMSQLGRFIAFQAAVSLLKERNQQEVLKEVQALCLQQIHFSSSQMQNGIKKIYAPFSQEEISRKIAELITPPFSSWDGSIQVIYQSLEGLHEAMPGFTGDWYFSGNYPTPGGVGVLNNSFLKWLLGDTSRSY